MSGPIVRTAPTPKFSENWEKAFGNKKSAKSAKTSAKPAKKKKAAKGKK